MLLLKEESSGGTNYCWRPETKDPPNTNYHHNKFTKISFFQIEKQTISLCKQGNIEATLACWQHYPAPGRTSAERSRKFYPENILIFIYSLKFGRYFKFKWTSGERLRKSCPRNILFNLFTTKGKIIFSSGKRSRKFILRGFSVVLFTCGPGFNVEHLEVKRRRLVNITCSKFYGRPSNAICDSCDDS